MTPNRPAGTWGRPSWDDRHEMWEQYAFDPQERAQVGHRSREWTAVSATELEVIGKLVRCLQLIRVGHLPAIVNDAIGHV